MTQSLNLFLDVRSTSLIYIFDLRDDRYPEKDNQTCELQLNRYLRDICKD